MSLDEILTLDSYLKTFGPVLAKQAISLLDPLHVPGRDPLTEFDYHREPFEPQKHVIEASVKMLDAGGSGFIVGEMGCIAGESEVYDPVADCHRRVDQITEPFHVYSWHDGVVVIGTADVPFIKGRKNLFRVDLAYGKTSFLATDDHRILVRSEAGEEWITVDEARMRLSAGKPVSCRAVTIAHSVQATGWNPIEGIRFEREDDYFDFTVDEYHNYVMAGVVHHNTGKTLLGQCAIHQHASRSRRQGGRNGKYRALVLCPDHLIDKWVREIEATIPGAVVTVFNKTNDKKADDSWKAVLALARRRQRTAIGQPAKWLPPTGPEWFVMGRNQVKFDPGCIGVGESHVGFDGKERELRSVRTILDEHRLKNYRVMCPTCGSVGRDKKRNILEPEEVAKKQCLCYGKLLVEQPTEKKTAGLDRFTLDGDWFKHEARAHSIDPETVKPGRKWESPEGDKYVVTECGEPLFNWVARPNKWAPAKIVQRQLKRFFHYLVIDEVHEQKSDESAQSMAAGKLMGSVQHTLALTGTLIGGYANHIYPLLVRMCGQSLREEGFEWGREMPFNHTYGRVDTIITTTSAGESLEDSSRGRSVKSMRRVSGGSRSTKREAVKPGIMPALFARHLLGNSVFITLEEMASELPDLHEFVADGCVEMPEVLADEYKRIESILTARCTELLTKGSMKLLGAMLHTLLDYPDKPFDWGMPQEFVDYARREGRVPERDGNGMAVGYWENPQSRAPENWVGVVQPADLDKNTIWPKERKLIDICRERANQGRQVWVYLNMTGKRDVQGRLQRLLEAEGLRCGILRRDTVPPRQREAWIAKNGRKFNVILSHPQLVSTGLDLFSKEKGGHNFSTIVFYQTGYNLFTMRQASRRAWRIGQPEDCEVFYLYYKDTMQHRAMQLMSRKLQAAQALEGEFSAEGLTALAGDDSGQMALAKALTAQVEDTDIQRGWGKVKSTTKKIIGRTLLEVPPTLVLPAHNPLDHTPPAYQLVAETIIAECEAIEREAAAVAVAEPPRLRLVNDRPTVPKFTRAQLAKMFARMGADLDELLSDD